MRAASFHGSVQVVVALIIINGVVADAFADCIFKPASLEQCALERDAGKGFVGFEDTLRHAHINVLAGLDVHSQTAKHDSDQAAGTGANDEVEVVARLGDFMSLGCPSLDLHESSVHELLQQDEHRIAADASAI